MKPVILTFKSGEDLSAKQFLFVKFGSTKDAVVLCGANERAIGVLQNIPAAATGSVCEVAVFGGGAYLQLGGTVALGKHITSQADGQGEVADAADEFCPATCMEDGVSGDVIQVALFPMYSAASEA